MTWILFLKRLLRLLFLGPPKLFFDEIFSKNSFRCGLFYMWRWKNLCLTSSRIREPIRIKFWGCIQFTLGVRKRYVSTYALSSLPRYFFHGTYMRKWGNALLPVQGRNRKSKIAPCNRPIWTPYTLQVWFQSVHGSRRRSSVTHKKNHI